ncbi:ATP-binding protein [Myxococcus sp. K15C18031901]|uniref:AAA family ATPase n=1 Tax=Myxococcus dinghuensis TaxID=2906761 RepID=UPI0020A715D5|nr:AAA family ATPase [Myxococcus dinghuensis]MCP3104499.1 ATP-binding protein [Myxococcus dinghuensis]
MNTLIIGIAGTHSTGKSTFVETLQERISSQGFRAEKIGDLATNARSKGFPILRDHTFESTLWLMATGIQRELEALNSQPDVLFVDRPLPDALGYLFAALDHRAEMIRIEERRYLVDLARNHAQRYGIVFLTSPDQSMGIDKSKERDHDEAFRMNVARQMPKVFMELGINTRTLTFRNRGQVLDETVAEILGHLNGIKPIVTSGSSTSGALR